MQRTVRFILFVLPLLILVVAPLGDTGAERGPAMDPDGVAAIRPIQSLERGPAMDPNGQPAERFRI